MPKNGKSFLAELGIQKPPENDEIELSVFGRGYGECLVISCGFKEFIVVDSFINNETGNPIALDYLEAMGVSSFAIKQVVLTHWHQDHITGISEILKKASPDAKLVISPIVKQGRFFEYISIGIHENNQSTNEFAKIMDFVKNNTNRIKIPDSNKVVFPYTQNGNGVEIYTLSPNDSDLIEYINAIRMPDEQRKTSYSFPEDNSLSIVMLIKFRTDGVLLGSDFENVIDSNSGWKRLISEYYHTRNKPSLIKIPHHGSSNAHNDDLWKDILSDKPLSVLTVFNKSTKLPKDSDVDRIKNLSQSLFIVGDLKALKTTDKDLVKRVKHFPNIKIAPVSTKIGLSRFRRSVDKLEWNIEMFGSVSKQ